MSVAFRRESDEEHLEPKFGRPIPPGPNLVTPNGLAAMQAMVTRFDAEVAGAPDEETRTALRRDQRYWQTRLASAQLAPAPADGEAGIGSRVTFRLQGTERRIAIVGSDEADGRDAIAFTAPLARALIGSAAGDVLACAGRDYAIEVLAVESL
ncbi:MAG TPA: GreA/GreB family elongation factor [Sphingomonas sp.]|jgi:transcription elongation GreA/GreB family factor